MHPTHPPPHPTSPKSVDGNVLSIAENVSDSTGLGLGVHTTIDPKDAESYAVSDGQKDVFALFDRRTTAVKVRSHAGCEGCAPMLRASVIAGGSSLDLVSYVLPACLLCLFPGPRLTTSSCSLPDSTRTQLTLPACFVCFHRPPTATTGLVTPPTT
jgi:hypothetical protein